MTANDKEEQFVLEGYKAGAVDYLFKPINPGIMTSKVRVFLELYRQRVDLNEEIVRRERAEVQLAELLNRERQASSQFHETAKKADSANRAKSEFLANSLLKKCGTGFQPVIALAHNPIEGDTAYSHRLEAGATPEEQHSSTGR